ncbi:hypothetical protein H4219_002365 [Mycoemilia scoparia]|uniref:PX domain-containing protein n=1 Tax=Mycoemilia scoparia TaxID=417184 RepID=A0A9W8A5R7_9FUNG|nr:hypothetical protein H4219_002365 [Mycoemilia scoparia]
MSTDTDIEQAISKLAVLSVEISSKQQSSDILLKILDNLDSRIETELEPLEEIDSDINYIDNATQCLKARKKTRLLYNRIVSYKEHTNICNGGTATTAAPKATKTSNGDTEPDPETQLQEIKDKLKKVVDNIPKRYYSDSMRRLSEGAFTIRPEVAQESPKKLDKKRQHRSIDNFIDEVLSRTLAVDSDSDSEASMASVQQRAYKLRAGYVGGVPDSLPASPRSTESPHHHQHPAFDPSFEDSFSGDRPPITDVRIKGHETIGKGINTHTIYLVHVTWLNRATTKIRRRYNEFVLLRETLVTKFKEFRRSIPPLPPKRVVGNFDEEFLQEREDGLQYFLRVVSRHQVLGTSKAEELELWVKAVDAFDNAEYDLAITNLNIMDNSAKKFFNLGIVHARNSNTAEAVKNYTEAVKLDPYLAVAYFQRGVVRMILENNYEALEDFDEALRCLRGNKFIDYTQLGLEYKMYSCEIYYNRALCHFCLNEEKEALEDLNKALQEKETTEERHEWIQKAISSSGMDCPLFCVPRGVLYRPDMSKVKNATKVNYLGSAKVIADVKPDDPKPQQNSGLKRSQTLNLFATGRLKNPLGHSVSMREAPRHRRQISAGAMAGSHSGPRSISPLLPTTQSSVSLGRSATTARPGKVVKFTSEIETINPEENNKDVHQNSERLGEDIPSDSENDAEDENPEPHDEVYGQEQNNGISEEANALVQPPPSQIPVQNKPDPLEIIRIGLQRRATQRKELQRANTIQQNMASDRGLNVDSEAVYGKRNETGLRRTNTERIMAQNRDYQQPEYTDNTGYNENSNGLDYNDNTYDQPHDHGIGQDFTNSHDIVDNTPYNDISQNSESHTNVPTHLTQTYQQLNQSSHSVGSNSTTQTGSISRIPRETSPYNPTQMHYPVYSQPTSNMDIYNQSVTTSGRHSPAESQTHNNTYQPSPMMTPPMSYDDGPAESPNSPAYLQPQGSSSVGNQTPLSSSSIQRHLTTKRLTKIKLHIFNSNREKKNNLMVLIKQSDEFDRLFEAVTKKLTTMLRNQGTEISTKDFTLGYYDDEGEQVTMTDEDDWQIAKACAGGDISCPETNIVSDIKLWAQLRQEL